jgi:hypothetical protein
MKFDGNTVSVTTTAEGQAQIKKALSDIEQSQSKAGS